MHNRQLDKLLPDTLRLFRNDGVKVSHYSATAPVFSDVARFMHAAGHIKSADLFMTRDIDPRIIALYMKFVKEEYNETLEAFQNWLDIAATKEDNQAAFAELCDGLFDLIWVASGALIATGMPIRLIWAEGAYSNLCKIDQATGELTRREDGKVLKPEGWQPPQFAKIVEASGDYQVDRDLLKAANDIWFDDKEAT
jgi:hypothetical protein